MVNYAFRLSGIAWCLVLIVGSSPVQAAPKGRAIAIGLNSIDPAHYAGNSGFLQACEFDANDMAAIAKSQGLDVTKLLTRAATRQAVFNELSKAASELVAGDLLVVSYAGHGSRKPDGNQDEEDHQDEAWCLYDGMLWDDELGEKWAMFKPGVRIVVFSDSCYSGSVTRVQEYLQSLQTQPPEAVAPEDRELIRKFGDLLSRTVDRTLPQDQSPSPVRGLPDDVAEQTYQRNKAFYDDLESKVPGEASSRAATTCTVILISGCQDNQTAGDGTTNGRFTGELKRTWAAGAFPGDYMQFQQSIQRVMPRDQSPNYYVIGPSNPAFERQRPWTLAVPLTSGGGGGTLSENVQKALNNLQTAIKNLEAAISN